MDDVASSAEAALMFTPFTLRDMTLRNRIVMSPMCMYSAEDGTVNDFHVVHLGSRAMGGTGLVLTELTDVSPEGRISFGCAGMYKPEHIPAWKRVVDYVHTWTDAKIGIQLGHAGRKASTKVLWEGDNEPLDDGNWDARMQLYEQLRRLGVIAALEKAGIRSGQVFLVGKLKWKWE